MCVPYDKIMLKMAMLLFGIPFCILMALLIALVVYFILGETGNL